MAENFFSSKHLTAVCKKSNSKTVLEWIQNYITQRLIVLLQNTELSLTAMAYALNFLGTSPSEYRRQIAGA